MLCLSGLCWIAIIVFIIVVLHGIYREFVHRRMYKEIEKTTMFKCRGLLGSYLYGEMAGYQIRYQSYQKFGGGKNDSLWVIKITIVHPKKLFPSHIDNTNSEVIRVLNIIRPKAIGISKNKKLLIEIEGLPQNKDEILQLVQASLLLAKIIDCG